MICDRYAPLIRKALASAAFVAAAALLILLPVLHLILVAANFLVHLFILGLQLLTSRLPRIGLATVEAPGIEPFRSDFAAGASSDSGRREFPGSPLYSRVAVTDLTVAAHRFGHCRGARNRTIRFDPCTCS